MVMRYHNITPYQYFERVSPQLELDCKIGRIQLAQAAEFVTLAVGDSAYNRSELDKLGFRNTGNCPILLDLAAYVPAQAPPRLAHLTKGGPNILHVGRFMPQKRYEDLIRTFYFLQKIKPEARLILVGAGTAWKNTMPFWFPWWQISAYPMSSLWAESRTPN